VCSPPTHFAHYFGIILCSDSDIDLFGFLQVQGDEEVQCHRQVEYSAEVHLPNIVQQSWMRRIMSAVCFAHLELLIACFGDLRATAKELSGNACSRILDLGKVKCPCKRLIWWIIFAFFSYID
jgi:hypothetical protein